MHADEAFAKQALWLKERVDDAGRTLPPEARRPLIQLFGRVLRMEIDFHTAAYGEE